MVWFRNVFVDPEATVLVPGAQKQSPKVSILVGLFAAVGGFIYGYDTGLINSVSEMEYVRHQFAANHESFTAKEQSILTAILSLGTFFGALSAPLLSDTFGRKIAIIFSNFFVFMIGNICQVSAYTILVLCIGRFITGMSVGIISAVVPLYQAEASPKWVRGAIISTYQWAITWGLLVSSAVSQATHSIDSSASYRVPIGLQFLWSLFLGVGMLSLPESPRFYVRKDDIHAAAKALSRLRRVPPDDPGLIEELVEIKASHDYELSFGSYSIWDCFRSDKARPHQLKRLLTAVVLQAIQQCTGINFIFYYGVNFFTRTGVSNSYLISFITYAVNVAATVPGLFLVEIIGRRKILMLGGSIMGLANLLIGIVGVTADSMVANKVMIAFVCLFIASFAATWGPVVWVVTGEIFSLGVRGKSVAISAATNWLVNFVFAYITPYLVDTGTHTAALGTNIFFMWGGFNLIGVVFVYFMVYETKGLSLEQIDELYRSCPGAIGSSTFEVKLNFNQDETELGDLNLDQSKRDEGSTLPSTGISHSSSQPVAVQEKSEVTTDTLTQPIVSYNTSAFNPGYTIDLGYGLGVTNQNRGPPSLNTMSSDEESIPEREPVVFDSLSGYVSSLSSQNGTYGGPLTTESTSTGVSSAISASQVQKQQAMSAQSSTSQKPNNDYNDSSSSAESSLFDE